MAKEREIFRFCHVVFQGERYSYAEGYSWKSRAHLKRILAKARKEAASRGEKVVNLIGYYAARGKSGAATLSFALWCPKGGWSRWLSSL